MSTLSGLGTNRNRRQGFPVLVIFSILMLLAATGLFVTELLSFEQ